jgi:hypothetical protein
MEEWVTLYVYGNGTLECHKCRVYLKHQKAHMYVNVDHEIEEVLCEKCWKSEEEVKK